MYQMPFKSLLDSEDMEMDSDAEQDKIEIKARQGDTEAKISIEEKKLSL